MVSMSLRVKTFSFLLFYLSIVVAVAKSSSFLLFLSGNLASKSATRADCTAL